MSSFPGLVGEVDQAALPRVGEAPEQAGEALLLAFPGYPKEGGLLDFLGRLKLADSSVQISRLLATLFLAQNASPRVAISGKMISESSSIGWS